MVGLTSDLPDFLLYLMEEKAVYLLSIYYVPGTRLDTLLLPLTRKYHFLDFLYSAIHIRRVRETVQSTTGGGNTGANPRKKKRWASSCHVESIQCPHPRPMRSCGFHLHTAPRPQSPLNLLTPAHPKPAYPASSVLTMETTIKTLTQVTHLFSLPLTNWVLPHVAPCSIRDSSS